MPTESAAEAVRYVVLGTVLPEPLMLALRRMAQQEASARRFGADQEFGGAEHVQPLIQRRADIRFAATTGQS